MTKRLSDFALSQKEVLKRSRESQAGFQCDLLYAQWLLRAIRREGNTQDCREMEARLDKILTHLESMEDAPVKIGPIDNPEAVTVTVNLYQSKVGLKRQLDDATSYLMLQRTFLKIDHPDRFPKEPKLGQGTDITKKLTALQSILDWYDKNNGKHVYQATMEKYGEESVQDDNKYNSKKQAYYERLRQAETCLLAAKSGVFPPPNLTGARKKSPKSRGTSKK
ncbi:MAG: hypothetical protein CXR31_09720 [Geobacter sp.]|nr:MAG: hypothetical protein CXR31_09720 [Geobacter sp.]